MDNPTIRKSTKEIIPDAKMKYLHVKKCMNCGDEYTSKRSDSKFCNELCKSAYNNRKQREKSKFNDDH